MAPDVLLITWGGPQDETPPCVDHRLIQQSAQTVLSEVCGEVRGTQANAVQIERRISTGLL
jgi:hypothetical protein